MSKHSFCIYFLYSKMNITDSHILFLPYTHTISHLSRPLEIAKRLHSIGGKTSFAGERSSKIKFIEEEGFQIHPLFEPDPDVLFDNIRSRKIKFVADKILKKMINEDLLLFEKLKPDVVVTDGRFSAMISTQLAGIKHIGIVNGSSTAYRAVPYVPFFKQNIFNQSPPKKLFPKLLNPINLKIEMFMFDNIMNIFKSLSKKYILNQKVTATNCLCGVDLTLLADIPEFFPTLNLPSDYHYIGPITWKAPFSKRLPDWWPIEKKGRKLIYITMGTTGESGLFQKIYNELKDMEDLVIIITTGSQSDEILSIPNKVYVTDFMDGDAIMDICDMVICHGGNGTIYQALSHAVPIIGIPTIPDQDFNMRRVEALGLGHKIPTKTVVENPQFLINTIRDINENKNNYATSLKKIQKILSKTNGAKTGSEIILNYIRKVF